MAGGILDIEGISDKVEIINLETLRSCVVDLKLDQPRYGHTLDGDLVCGGRDDNHNKISTCYNIVTGKTINLNNDRYYHTSWSSSYGILLIGGFPYSFLKTTELITGDSTKAGFELKYATE